MENPTDSPRADGFGGGREAFDPAFAELYDELRAVAAVCFRKERSGHTLQPTALVHEVYMRLSSLDRIQWQNRSQVLAVAAVMMRHILVSYARRRNTLRRLRPCSQVELPPVAGSEAEVCDALAVHEALIRMSESHPQHAKVMELRFFGGLTEIECAEYLTVSRATVQRQYSFARAWLLRELISPNSVL